MAIAATAARGHATIKPPGSGIARRRATGATALLAVLLASPAAADGARPEFPVSEGSTYSFTFENDIFGGDDKTIRSLNVCVMPMDDLGRATVVGGALP